MEPGFSRGALMRSMRKWMGFWLIMMQYVLFTFGSSLAAGFTADWRWRVFGGLALLVPLDYYLVKVTIAYWKLADIWDAEDAAREKKRKDENDIREAEAIRARALILEEKRREELEQYEQARLLAEIIEDLDDRGNSR